MYEIFNNVIDVCDTALLEVITCTVGVSPFFAGKKSCLAASVHGFCIKILF